jgi:ADP-ribose pyrophosphatase YjhB (NUDIX family)
MSFVKEIREAIGDGRPLLLAGTALLLTDPDEKLLLVRRADDDTWGLVGGYLEIGETPEDAARREAKEETGFVVADVDLFGVFAGPDIYHDYDEGRVYGVTVVYTGRAAGGAPKVQPEEVKEARFFAPDALPATLERSTGPILARYREAARR